MQEKQRKNEKTRFSKIIRDKARKKREINRHKNFWREKEKGDFIIFI